jgi:hypothetical protein
VVTTCEEHGLSNNGAIPILPHSAHFPAIPSWAQLPSNARTWYVLVENSSVPENNGVWALNTGREPVSNDASDTFTLAGHGFSNGDRLNFTVPVGQWGPGLYDGNAYYVVNATADTFQISDSVGGPVKNVGTINLGYGLRVNLYPSATKVDVSGLRACAENCGTMRLLYPIHIKGVEGNTAANGSSYFYVEDDTHIRLLDRAGSGDYNAGGVLALEPTHWVTLVSIGHTSSRVHFDRCLFQPGGWPTRVSITMAHGAAQSSIINNYFDDNQFFRHVTPGSNQRIVALNTWGLAGNPFYIAGSTALDTSSGSTKLIENNYLEAHGITMFSTSDNTTAPTFENAVIRRNTFYVSDSKRAGSPTSDGLYYVHRHHLEWKRGSRMLIDGNRFIGGWIDYNVCGPTIMMTPRSSQDITDLTFTNNTIEGGTTALYWIGVDDGAASLTPMVSRVRFHNNIVTDLDGYRVANPRDVWISSNCGFPLYMRFGSESVSVTHNLFRWARGAATQTFSFSEGRGSGLTIKNNILWYTNDEGTGPLWKQGSGAATSAGTPHATGNQRQIFDALWSHSVFANNIVVPGPRSTSNLAKFDSKSPQDTLFASDCVNYFAGFESVFCVGKPSGGDSANERMAMLGFQAPENGNFRLRSNSPAASGSFAGIDGQQRAAAQHLSSDAKDVGPDHDSLEAAQGGVLNPHTADVEADRATVVYIAPDANACAVDYATQPFPVPGVAVTRVFDGGGERTRKVQLTGLAGATMYYYQILCAAAQPVGTFQTL